MRILALLQKFDPDDHILGFLYTWLIKIAKQIDELYTVSLETKRMELDKNIKLFSLGKESGFHKARIFYNFHKIISGIFLRKRVDLVFVLMCPEYTFLVFPYAKITEIPIAMWYAHGNINRELRIAHFLVNRVITSSKDSFRIKSNKLVITGQGIDVDKFKVKSLKLKEEKQNNEKIILSVGRISPVKNYEVLIKTADILINQNNIKDLRFQIVGDVPIESQSIYLDFLKHSVSKYKLQGYIQFVGPLPYTQIQDYYQNCHLFVSASNTGSLDKAVLEAMACRKITLTSNEAFNDLLKNYSDILLFNKNDAADLAKRIIHILEMDNKEKDAIACDLREMVVREHNLDRFIENVLRVFKETLKNN